jgi:major inositol transporter-like SP family MFS transporter
VTCPLYLAEMAPADRRGRMVTINELMIVTGQFLAFAMNALLDALIKDPHVWRWMLAVATIPAVALLVGMFFLPDSPRWYAVRGRLGETKRVLGLSRDPAEAAEEYNVIAEHAKRDVSEDKGAALSDLREFPWMRRILWIGCGLATVQQATGINTVNYYAPTILESTGLGASASLILTITVGVVAIIGTILGIVLIGHFNRRTLLLTGFTGVAAGHAILALSFLLPESGFRSYLILAAMLVVVFFVQTFIGTLVWLLLSEIFPMTIRGFAMGIAVFVLWTVNAAISFAFPPLVAALGATPTFGLFALINVGGSSSSRSSRPRRAVAPWRSLRTTSGRTTPGTSCTRPRPGSAAAKVGSEPLLSRITPGAADYPRSRHGTTPRARFPPHQRRNERRKTPWRRPWTSWPWGAAGSTSILSRSAWGWRMWRRSASTSAAARPTWRSPRPGWVIQRP